MESYIYDSGTGKHATQFAETTEKLMNYIQSNYKCGEDIAGALRQLQELTITIPDAPTGQIDENGNVLPVTMANEHHFKCEFDAAFF